MTGTHQETPGYSQAEQSRWPVYEPGTPERNAADVLKVRYGFALGLVLFGFLTWGVSGEPFAVYVYAQDFGPLEFLLLLFPIAMVVAGLLVLPASWARRLTAAVVVGGPMLAVAVVLEFGGEFMQSLLFDEGTLPLAQLPIVGIAIAWLIARGRPGLSYLALLALVPMLLLATFTSLARGQFGTSYRVPFLPDSYDSQLFFYAEVTPWGTLFLPTAAVVAWIAAGIAKVAKQERAAPPEVAPPIGQPPAHVPGSAAPATGTNLFAILALVFGLLGGWLGVVFGHISLAQIRKTGEQGHGMAVAGLVLGYIGVLLTIAYLVFWFLFYDALFRWY